MSVFFPRRRNFERTAVTLERSENQDSSLGIGETHHITLNEARAQIKDTILQLPAECKSLCIWLTTSIHDLKRDRIWSRVKTMFTILLECKLLHSCIENRTIYYRSLTEQLIRNEIRTGRIQIGWITTWTRSRKRHVNLETRSNHISPLRILTTTLRRFPRLTFPNPESTRRTVTRFKFNPQSIITQLQSLLKQGTKVDYLTTKSPISNARP